MARLLFRDVMLPVCQALTAKVTAAEGTKEWGEARAAQMVAHQSFALTLGALWERELQDYLLAAAALIVPDDAEVAADIRAGSLGRLKAAFLTIREVPLTAFPMYGRLRQLHMVTSAVRHGVGPSADRLLKEEPSLFGPPVVAGWFAYFTTSTEPASVSRLDITAERLEGYAEAVASFWDAIVELRDRSNWIGERGAASTAL